MCECKVLANQEWLISFENFLLLIEMKFCENYDFNVPRGLKSQHWQILTK